MSSKPSFLNSSSSLPVPLTIAHYHVFSSNVGKTKFKEEKLDSPESWDMLRSNDPLFTIPSNREEWVAVSEQGVRKDGQDIRLKERALAVSELCKSKGVTTLFSVGSGGAGLEYLILKAFPLLKVVCSEYAPKSVETLKEVFLEAEDVVRLDIRSDDWKIVTHRPDANSTVCVMYRLDAQFTDSEWRKVFSDMFHSGVFTILYIPTGFLTLRSLVSRLRTRVVWMLTGKPMVFSGYLRTKQVFDSYWSSHFTATEYVLGGMTGFWLTRK